MPAAEIHAFCLEVNIAATAAMMPIWFARSSRAKRTAIDLRLGNATCKPVVGSDARAASKPSEDGAKMVARRVDT
jgi:hypothetical protein